jgi:hypothetical protein
MGGMQMNQLVKLLRITGPTILVLFICLSAWSQEPQKPMLVAGADGKEVRVNGLTLHYIERGQGTPVVLVHGTLGTTARGMGSLRRCRRDII